MIKKLAPLLVAAIVATNTHLLSNVCEVHGTALREVYVPIMYGHPVLADHPPSARVGLFPNARANVSAGCVVRPREIAPVDHCPVCLEVRRGYERGLADALRQSASTDAGMSK